MNVGLAMVLSLAFLLFGLFGYSRLVAGWLGLDPERPTPAVEKEDGIDYVPAQPLVLFGHHFASIAAAGPIVGPAMAAMFGFYPAWFWLLFGVVLIGAVHDFSALFVSIREGGQSIAEVARTTLGTGGFLLYSAFALLLCILVSAAFLDITAKTLTSTMPLAVLGLPESQTLLATWTDDAGALHARIGGIASTSVIVITAMAPALGWAVYRRGMSVWLASALAILGCLISAAIGLALPLTISPSAWMVVVLAYTVVAGFVPVWLIIQPRDFINVHFLYGGLIVMVGSLIGCGLNGVVVDLPATNFEQAATYPNLGQAWPFLFITIACGSVSGAHGLIAGGTTSKQVANENHARWIGYGGMLLESLLGICVLLLLSVLGHQQYMALMWDEGNPGVAAAFATAVGQGLYQGLGSPAGGTAIAAYGTIFGVLLLEGFLVTTIDTVVRLARYLLEEIWTTLTGRERPNRIATTLAVVVPVAVLAFTSGYKTIWPVFGGANQLLAALTLIAVTAWLVERGRSWWFAAIPAAFMTVTTVMALWTTLWVQIGAGKYAVAAAAVVLLALAAGVLGVVGQWLMRPRAQPAARG